MAFLIPAIPWLLGLIFTAGAIAAVHELLADKTKGKVLAILGESMSGKTTLTHLLAQGIVGKAAYERTLTDELYKGSTVNLSNGTKLHVADLRDLPGDVTAWLSWKKRVQESDHVLYLIHSHSLRSRTRGTRERCRRDLQQLKIWLTEMDGSERPTVLLVFSFRDKEPRLRGGTTSYADDLIDISSLKPAVDALRRLTIVRFASGSTNSAALAQALLDEIGAAL